jgi:hypothetical protein
MQGWKDVDDDAGDVVSQWDLPASCCKTKAKKKVFC